MNFFTLHQKNLYALEGLKMESLALSGKDKNMTREELSRLVKLEVVQKNHSDVIDKIPSILEKIKEDHSKIWERMKEDHSQHFKALEIKIDDMSAAFYRDRNMIKGGWALIAFLIAAAAFINQYWPLGR